MDIEKCESCSTLSKIIEELKVIEKKKWDDEEHCSCLEFVISKLSRKCEDECGECRINPPK